MKTLFQGAMLALIAALLPLNGAGSDLPEKEIPFSKGINMGFVNMFSVKSSHQQLIRERQEFVYAKMMGADVLRVTIDMRISAGPAPGYLLEPAFFAQLDSTVLWASEQGLSLIIEGGMMGKLPEDLGAWLPAVWAQVAEHYKGKSSMLLYQLCSSYTENDDVRFGLALQSAIDAIRKIDTQPAIIVNSARMNDPKSFGGLPYFGDPKLYYGFCLDYPQLFTRQADAGTITEMAVEIPFPYSKNAMPDCPTNAPSKLKAMFAEFPQKGTGNALQAQIRSFAAFAKEREATLICLEFFAGKGGHHPEYRLEWHKQAVTYMDAAKMPYLIWDFSELCKQDGGGYTEHDLDTDLVRALGFSAIGQTSNSLQPLAGRLDIFDESFPQGIQPGSFVKVSNEAARSGSVSLKLANMAKYQPYTIEFKRYLDFTQLLKEDYRLHFYYNTTASNVVSLRFFDTKQGDANDRPWRMEYRFTPQIADGSWQEIYIPLSSFKESGSKEAVSEPARGAFDWSKIDKFEISSELRDLKGPFFIDELSIEAKGSHIDESLLSDSKIYKYLSYNEQSEILKVSDIKDVNLLITGVQGQIALQKKITGQDSYFLSSLPKGVYVVRLYKDSFIVETMKIIIK